MSAVDELVTHEVEIDGERAAVIQLTQGKVAFVDVPDLARISARLWTASESRPGQFYAYAACYQSGQRQTLSMHHEVLLIDSQVEIDHRNGNGLDNRRMNLRTCSHQQNTWNRRPRTGCTSRFKGVSWYRAHDSWRAYIVLNARQKHLGYFADEIEAARAYDKAAAELFGEFARLNFPIEKGCSING